MTSFSDAAATWNKRFAADDYVFGTAAAMNTFATTRGCGRRGRACCAWRMARDATACGSRSAASPSTRSMSPTSASPRRASSPRAACVTVSFQLCDADDFAWPAEAYDGVAAIFVQFADPAMRP